MTANEIIGRAMLNSHNVKWWLFSMDKIWEFSMIRSMIILISLNIISNNRVWRHSGRASQCDHFRRKISRFCARKHRMKLSRRMLHIGIYSFELVFKICCNETIRNFYLSQESIRRGKIMINDFNKQQAELEQLKKKETKSRE